MKFLLDEVVKPLLRRIGTVAGSTLSALGASSELTSQVETVVPLVLGLLFDLAWSHRNRLILRARGGR